MAYHFRKLKNTLRLLPSTKTIGFSTRLNEGDGVNACPDGGQAAASVRFSDSAVGSLRLAGRPNLSNNSDLTSSLARSQSDPDLVCGHFLPAVISDMPSNTLPVTFSDLAQILRLPLLPASSKDLQDDFASVLRLVHPTSDDILVQESPVVGGRNTRDKAQDNNMCRKDCFSNLVKDHSLETGKRVLHEESQLLSSNTGPLLSPLTTSSTFDKACLTHALSSDCNTDHSHHPGFTAFSPSSPVMTDPPSSPTDLPGPQGGRNPGKDGPTPEQMHKIKEKLENTVCKLFSGRQDYSILHKNVVLKNNLFGDNKTCVGMLAYGIEILKLRLRIHARFSNTSVELQSVTMLEQNGVIRIHWRLKGLSQIQTLKFWRAFQSKTAISKDDYEWLEAFSYFHIGKDGLVHKHRIDRMIPDDTSGTEKITNTLRELLTPAKPLVS